MQFVKKGYICIGFVIMTEEDSRQLGIFEARFRHLLYLYEQIKQKNGALMRELVQKDEKIKKLEERCLQAELSYKNLKTARIISISDNESRDTRQRLARLVREIDKCIALLNG